MLTINNPDDAEKRQNVKPLTVEEEKNVTADLSFFLEESNATLEYCDKVQRLIHNYENYRHFFEVAGGWEGLSKLRKPKLVIATKEWIETTDNKNGFIDSDWNCEGVNLDDYELIYILEQYKFYNPTKALFKKNKYHNPVTTVLKKVIETIKTKNNDTIK